jgi:formylglycine-generating enzyme required for sulfatase activity
MPVNRYRNRWMTNLTVFFLTFLFLRGSLVLPRQEDQGNRLEGLFQWAVMDFQSGKYHQVGKKLQLLLNYFEEEDDALDKKDKTLKGKIYLLLAAVYERLGGVRKAREYYDLADGLLEECEIPGLDLSPLVEYQRIVMNRKKPRPEQRIIVKPASKPRKKRLSILAIAAGAAIAAGVAALLLTRKKSPGIEMEADYDTRVLGVEWVRVPAGAFMMGDNFNEGDEDELPVHEVYLDGYYISRHEVTFAQYDKFCDQTGRIRPGDNGWGKGDRPVIDVSWLDASRFCEWLSAKTGKAIRLPTEAQWEKAARGTDQRRYPWGNSPPGCEKTNYNYCDSQTHPVGSHAGDVSPYGIHDMAGNVLEWCRDQYEPKYYSMSSPVNPENKPAELKGYIHYVIRGGSWKTEVRCADRRFGRYYWGSATRGEKKDVDLGFRVVMEDY